MTTFFLCRTSRDLVTPVCGIFAFALYMSPHPVCKNTNPLFLFESQATAYCLVFSAMYYQVYSAEQNNALSPVTFELLRNHYCLAFRKNTSKLLLLIVKNVLLLLVHFSTPFYPYLLLPLFWTIVDLKKTFSIKFYPSSLQ